MLSLSEANEELPGLKDQVSLLTARVVELEEKIAGVTREAEEKREKHSQDIEDITSQYEATIQVSGRGPNVSIVHAHKFC